MKKFKSLFLFAVMMTFIFAGTIAVSASPTDLSSMKIYGVDAAGTKTEVPIDFSSTVYSYDITVKSNVQKLEIEYTPEDSTSKAEIVNELYNTTMDTGAGNKTQVKVTAADGTSALYTVNTTKLTPEQDASYDEGTTTAKPAEKEVSVQVGKKTFKVSRTISGDVPKGFEKSTYKYKGKKYECIVKGDADKLVALYLHNSKTQGFYIYNEDKDTFYELKNIQIASRMYTIVQVDDTAKILKNYERKTIDIGNESAKAWVLNEDEDLYLVYAMNWDEEVNLYSYDAREHDFQRYPVSEDTFSQKEAAEVAYTNLQTNRNQLARKYNMLLKIIGGLMILIVILIFIIINMKLSKKSKNLEYDEQYDSESDEDNDAGDRKLTKEEKKAEKLRKKEEKKKAKLKDALPEDELLEDLPEADEVLEKEQEAQPADLEDGTAENVQEPEDTAEDEKKAENAQEPESAAKDQEKAENAQEPENTAENQEKAENAQEAESAAKDQEKPESGSSEAAAPKAEESGETPKKSEQTPNDKNAEIEENSAAVQKETEDDLRETLKAMLPEDDEDDDDDFEFIELD